MENGKQFVNPKFRDFCEGLAIILKFSSVAHPHAFVMDNGKQFDNLKFRDFYEGLVVILRFSSVFHPQANDQIEFQNKDILIGLKRRLEKAKGKWADELPKVLWSIGPQGRRQLMKHLSPWPSVLK